MPTGRTAPPRGMTWASEIFCEDILKKDGDAQRLFRDHLLQQGVFLLQLAQTLGVRHIHAPDLRPPLVKGAVGNAVLTAQVHYKHPGFSLALNPDDRFFAESASLHNCTPILGTLTFPWISF